MKKRIGIVGEGPTDYLVLKCMIDQITGEENDYLRIQPEQNMLVAYRQMVLSEMVWNVLF